MSFISQSEADELSEKHFEKGVLKEFNEKYSGLGADDRMWSKQDDGNWYSVGCEEMKQFISKLKEQLEGVRLEVTLHAKINSKETEIVREIINNKLKELNKNL